MNLQNTMVFTLNVILKGRPFAEMRNWCQFFITVLSGHLFLGFFKISQIILDALQMSEAFQMSKMVKKSNTFISYPIFSKQNICFKTNYLIV